MKTFSLAVLGVIAYFFVIGLLVAGASAFNQADTLPARSKEVKTVDSTRHDYLEKKEALLDQRKDVLRDSIAQNLEKMGKLPPKTSKINTTLKVAETNLKQTILKSDGGVQSIETVYRIDTSPRPVVINVVFQTEQPAPKRKGLFRK